MYCAPRVAGKCDKYVLKASRQNIRPAEGIALAAATRNCDRRRFASSIRKERTYLSSVSPTLSRNARRKCRHFKSATLDNLTSVIVAVRFERKQS
jgi:hypothetical protein